jgi:transposase-like protein
MTKTQRNDAPAHTIARPLQSCPECGSERLKAVVEGGLDPAVHFFCEDCARCWNVQLGSYWRVAPGTCAGCAQRERCEAAYVADHAGQ